MFSNSYRSARHRFIQASQLVGAQLSSYDVDVADELTVDVAVLNPDGNHALVITSGLHGIEGFVGSAAQIAWLDRLQQDGVKNNIKFVLVHALNPYGFENLRRTDQDNIDLNRNFLIDASRYQGAPIGYAKLNHFLNPESPPSKLEPYKLKALWTIWRYGLPALKSSIVTGQYEYPNGIFYGGSAFSKAAHIIKQNIDQWLGDADTIVHVDLHSGLGDFADYKLLLNETESSRRYSWYASAFDDRYLEAAVAKDATAYEVTGSLGSWLQNKYSDRQYYFVNAEFGTYNATRVLGAIRAENRAHRFCDPSDPTYVAAKTELKECFCPQSEQWRKQVLESSLDIIEAAVKGLASA